MKKMIATVALASTIALFGIQQAGAQMGMGAGNGPGDCWKANQQNVQVMDEETKKSRDAFMDASVDLRRDMATKRAEMRALMHGDNPDEKKAGNLAGEMFDLRGRLLAKAEETGWKGGLGLGAGQGRNGCGGCDAKGRHHGKAKGMGGGSMMDR